MTLLAELDATGFDLIVLLCTGSFRQYHLQTPFIESDQRPLRRRICVRSAARAF